MAQGVLYVPPPLNGEDALVDVTSYSPVLTMNHCYSPGNYAFYDDISDVDSDSSDEAAKTIHEWIRNYRYAISQESRVDRGEAPYINAVNGLPDADPLVISLMDPPRHRRNFIDEEIELDVAELKSWIQRYAEFIYPEDGGCQCRLVLTSEVLFDWALRSMSRQPYWIGLPELRMQATLLYLVDRTQVMCNLIHSHQYMLNALVNKNRYLAYLIGRRFYPIRFRRMPPNVCQQNKLIIHRFRQFVDDRSDLSHKQRRLLRDHRHEVVQRALSIAWFYDDVLALLRAHQQLRERMEAILIGMLEVRSAEACVLPLDQYGPRERYFRNIICSRLPFR